MVQIKRAAMVAAVLMMAIGTMGCGKANQEAQDGFGKIKAACEADKKDEANKLGADLYAKSEVFKKTIDAATADVKDKKDLNYCAPLVQSEVKMRLQNL